jgi:FkbM family methyltransferase
VRALLKKLLAHTPYRISRNAPNRFDGIEAFLGQVARRGYRPRVIIDGGAHLGWFAKQARTAFPAADIHLVEPQPACAPALKAMATLPGFHFHPVALTSERKTVRMVCDDTLDTGAYVAWDANQHQATIDVQGDTLDALFADRIDVGSRAFVKLDLQGHELMALAGGRQILRHVELVLTEFSFFSQLKAASSADLLRFLDEAEFDLFDIVSVAGRRRDDRARQGDFVFARRHTPLWADRTWE